MKLQTLRALVFAIDTGSLRNAAKEIGVSQPALTKMIQEIERELGAALLVRTTRGVVPTAQGKVLYDQAQKVVRELGVAVDRISQLSGRMTGMLSVCAVPLAVMLLIPETLRTFGREFPEIRLRITEELYFAQLQRLRRGEVEVAVGGIPEGLSNGEFAVEQLMSTTMVPVVRKGSPRLRARSLAELADARWVYTGASSDEGYAKLLFESNGLPPPPVGAVVNSTLALLSLVGTGDFVALMPEQIASHPVAAPFISTIPVEEGGLPLTIGAIVRKEFAMLPAVRHFIAHLHRAAHHVG